MNRSRGSTLKVSRARGKLFSFWLQLVSSQSAISSQHSAVMRSVTPSVTRHEQERGGEESLSGNRTLGGD